MTVYFSDSARKSILGLSKYLIEEIKAPLTAEKYISKMEVFAINLGKFYSAFSECKNKKLAARKLKCAVFNKKWVFAFV